MAVETDPCTQSFPVSPRSDGFSAVASSGKSGSQYAQEDARMTKATRTDLGHLDAAWKGFVIRYGLMWAAD